MKEINFEMVNKLPYEIISSFFDQKAADQNTQKLIDGLIKKYDQGIFSIILYKLTQKIFIPFKAKEIWEMILFHKERLNKFLRRDVGIFVASMDYFSNFGEKHIKMPLIIDNSYLLALKNNAFRDDSTGLYNVMYYEKRINQEIAESKRYKNPFSLLLVRVYYFENLPENLSMINRKQIVNEISDQLKTMIRVSDELFHSQADEFIILLSNTTEKGVVFQSKRIYKTINEKFSNRNVNIELGVAVFNGKTQKNSQSLYALACANLGKINDTIQYFPEQRKFKRMILNRNANVSMDIFEPQELNSKISQLNNISKMGISFQVQEKVLNISELIQGLIKKDDLEIKFKGRVVWTHKVQRNEYAIGVKFLSTSS